MLHRAANSQMKSIEGKKSNMQSQLEQAYGVKVARATRASVDHQRKTAPTTPVEYNACQVNTTQVKTTQAKTAQNMQELE